MRLGCAIGALEGEPIRLIKAQVDDFGGAGKCTLIGGGRTAPDRATLYNSALVRYLDFNDSYLAKGETCHPSDNLGAVLAASEYADASGRELMTALAVAYQVQCRLSDIAPVRAKGFDHTTQGAYAVAAGVSRALRLDETQHGARDRHQRNRLQRPEGYPHRGPFSLEGIGLPQHRLRMCACGLPGHAGYHGSPGGLRRQQGVHGCHLRQIRTGLVAGKPGTGDKDHHQEVQCRNSLPVGHRGHPGAQDRRQGSHPGTWRQIEIEIFDVAYHIIGGGEEGDKTLVRTKEEADHSLPYMVAVALLDNQVMPEQYRPERINRQDVQGLLRKVTVHPSQEYSRRFPEEMPCRLVVTLRGGRILTKEKRDYEGFHTRPMGWETVIRKFEGLSHLLRQPDPSGKDRGFCCPS